MVVTVSVDGTARAWSLGTGNCTAVLQHTSSVLRAVFSPDNTRLATCATDTVPKLWDLASGQVLCQLQVPPVMHLQGNRAQRKSLNCLMNIAVLNPGHAVVHIMSMLYDQEHDKRWRACMPASRCCSHHIIQQGQAVCAGCQPLIEIAPHVAD